MDNIYVWKHANEIFYIYINKYIINILYTTYITVFYYDYLINPVYINPIYPYLIFNIIKGLKNFIIYIIMINMYYSCSEVTPQTLCDESNSIKLNTRKRFANLDNSNMTLNQILLVLFDTLQEYMSLNNIGEKIFSNKIKMDPLIDINNNSVVTTIHDIKQTCLTTDAAENIVNVETINKYSMTEDYINENAQTNDCNCNNNKKDCYPSLKPDRSCYVCNQPTDVTKSCEKTSTIFSMKDFSVAMNNLNNTLTNNANIFEKCKKSCYRDICNDFCVSKNKFSANHFIST